MKLQPTRITVRIMVREDLANATQLVADIIDQNGAEWHWPSMQHNPTFIGALTHDPSKDIPEFLRHLANELSR